MHTAIRLRFVTLGRALALAGLLAMPAAPAAQAQTASPTASATAAPSATSNQCSLREAIAEFNALAMGSTITLNVPSGTYVLSAGSPSSGRSLSISNSGSVLSMAGMGASASATAIDGGTADPAVKIAAG